MTNNRNNRIIIIILLGLSLFACSGDKSSSNSELEKITVSIIKDFSKGNYDKVTARFDSTMAANVDEDQLEQIWYSLSSQCGAYLQTGGAKTVLTETEVILLEN